MKIELTPKQTEYYLNLFTEEGKVRDSEAREFPFFGGFGCGKSRIVSLCVHQICLKYPNAHGVYIRATYPELKDSVIPQYLTYYPQTDYRFNKSERTAEYNNGTRLDFRAFDRDTKILSNEYDFIVFSQLEEIQYELFLQALGRNRRKAGGLPKNLILSEGNPASGWVKERYKDRVLPKEIILIEAKTRENPFLPADYEPTLRDNYPDFWIARYLDGEWSNLDELVFSEFRDDNIIEIIDPETIPKNYKRRNGLDWGWNNPSAIDYGMLDYEGRLVIYDEFYNNRTLPRAIAEECVRHGRILTVADSSTKGIKMPTEEDPQKTIWTELERYGAILEESNKNKLTNIVLLNSLFKQKRLLITRNCINLIKELRNYKWKKAKLGEEKNIPEEAIEKDNHAIDALLYLAASLEELKSISPKSIAHKNSLEYHTVRRQKRGWEHLA